MAYRLMMHTVDGIEGGERFHHTKQSCVQCETYFWDFPFDGSGIWFTANMEKQVMSLKGRLE